MADITATDLKYTRINTNTTTTIVSGPAILHAIMVNTAGATGNTATVYDSQTGSGNIVAVIDTTAIRQIIYDVYCPNGLTIVTATGSPADITVSASAL